MPSKLSENLEHLIEKKQEAIQQNQYDKYINLFEIAIQFLKKQERVLMYGGTAINSLMPKRYKFYSATELPDLDLFSTRAIGLANDLIREFKKKGYELASVQEALHIGTYKVLVNGVVIADISHISPTIFDRLNTNSVIGDIGIRICNPEFLRSTLYVILSQPQDSHRWTKVIERIISFNKVFPPKSNVALHYLSVEMKQQPFVPEKFIRDFAKEHKMIWTGESILKEILKLQPKWYDRLKNVFSPVPYTFLVEENANKMAHLFTKQYPELELTVGKSNDEEEFMQKHTNVYHKGKIVVTFVQLNNCLSYTQYKNSSVASFATLLRILYEFYFNTMDDAYLAWIHLLIAIELKHYVSKHKLLQVVNTECSGPVIGLFTLRRERFKRMIKKNKIHYKS